MTWLIPRNELSHEQIRAIELNSNEHRVIFGAAGSGKTQVLLHRARYLCDLNGCKPNRFHIFVFTKVLKEYIKSALNLLNLHDDCVSTLDAWCATFYKKHIRGRMPWNEQEKCPDFVAIRKAVLRELPGKPLYDFILVDEGQDLDGNSFELLRKIAKHVTVCIDHKQKIYEQGLNEYEILEKLNLKKRNMSLLDAFRCCPYIVKLASQFIENDEDRSTYILQARTEQTERESPLLYYADSFDDEKQRLIDLTKIRLTKNERIAILLPQNRQVYGFARGFLEAGLEVEWSGTYNFNSMKPKILTFHSAKGLTFDTVFIPRLVQKSFLRFNEENIARLLFVGITRAQKWVALLSDKKNSLPILTRLESLNGRDFLTIQEKIKPVSTQSLSKDDDLTDLL